ncbi:hypothetical protein ADUPG1_002802, partial [Aduncisulcus paluster]
TEEECIKRVLDKTKKKWQELKNTLKHAVFDTIEKDLHDDPSYYVCQAFQSPVDLDSGRKLEFDLSKKLNLILYIDEALVLDQSVDDEQHRFGIYFVGLRQILAEIAGEIMNNYDILVSICYSDTHSAVSNFISCGHPHLLKNFGEFYDHVDSKASIVTKGTKQTHIALLHSAKLSAENVTESCQGFFEKHIKCAKDKQRKIATLIDWMKNPKSCFFKATPSQLLTGVPLWTTTFLSGIKKKLNSCTKDELRECADSALRKVV